MSPSPVGQTATEAGRRRARQRAAYRVELARLQPYEELARQIIGLRMAHGLSQEALAQRVGTTKSAISRLESGQHAPTITTLEKVAAAFGRHLQVSFGEPAEDPRKIAVGAGR